MFRLKGPNQWCCTSYFCKIPPFCKNLERQHPHPSPDVGQTMQSNSKLPPGSIRPRVDDSIVCCYPHPLFEAKGFCIQSSVCCHLRGTLGNSAPHMHPEWANRIKVGFGYKAFEIIGRTLSLTAMFLIYKKKIFEIVKHPKHVDNRFKFVIFEAKG